MGIINLILIFLCYQIVAVWYEPGLIKMYIKKALNQTFNETHYLLNP